MLSNCATEAADGYEMFTEGVQIFEALSPFIVRSITTDISPILNWSNNEYTPFIDIPYEDECDNPKTTATSLYTTLDICNRFRDSLKPAFKLLGTKINEISEEVNSTDLTDQLTNYICKDELTREDKIDLFTKVDNDQHILTIESEDTLHDGFVIFKIYAGAKINQRARRFYIKISEGQMVNYKGVQDNEITIDGVAIKPLANSEDDKIEKIPTAELTEKLIRINITDPSYKIAGAIIEESTFIRHLKMTTDDLAYKCDIEALDKKITTLAEQSHANDAVMLSWLEENSEFRKKDDLSYESGKTITKNIEFVKDNDAEYYDEWIVAEYVEGAEFSIHVKNATNSQTFNFVDSLEP